ncbi:MAG: hypothetical protein D6712_04585 [Chloroflexi bacterium]|nr:MAG: hypothetical protein D6712_04585 [Chloroflexota bacterium]
MVNLPPTPPPTIATIRLPTPAPGDIYPWQNANDIMRGICFEAANDAAEQTFVIRNAEEHIRFYNLADNSQLCRRPVERVPFDFGQGQVLAGLWNRGMGCKARHEVIDWVRDDTAHTFSINLRLVIEGDCPYELVRPFWIALEGVDDYDISITVVERLHEQQLEDEQP